MCKNDQLASSIGCHVSIVVLDFERQGLSVTSFPRENKGHILY